MSDSESNDSPSQSLTPELQSENTTPLPSEFSYATERPILSKMGEGIRFEELLEMQLETKTEIVTQDVKQTPTTTRSCNSKRKFLKKGEGIARFTPAGAKLRKKQVVSKQTSSSSREEQMKRKVANKIPQTMRKPLPKRIPQLVQASAPTERRQNRGLSPIPFTPPSYMTSATQSCQYLTPPLDLTPKHISFQTVDNQLSSDTELFRIPSDDSVILHFARNEMQQREDLKEFQALEALIEAQADGNTSFEFDVNSPIDSPTFHALGIKAREYLMKRNNSISDTHLASPVSAANSSAYQNPLNNARTEDDEEWDEYLVDEIVTEEFWKQSPELRATEVLQEKSIPDSVREDKEIKLQTDKEEVSTLIQERVQELENEITEYQRLNAVMKRQEGKRQRDQNQLTQKLDEFEEYRKSELERMEKDYQCQMSAVKRERQRLEQYKHTYHSSEAKLLKQEIEILREQSAEAQDTLHEKETKNKVLVLRLKNNIKQAEFERDELRNQIALIESLRLKQWEQSADQPSAKQPARTKLKLYKTPSDEDLTYKIEFESEPTELFSDYSTSVDSDNNEENEISTIENTSQLNLSKNTDEPSKHCANSTAIPGSVDKLSERLLPNNSTEIVYFNNTRKVISPNGKLVTLYLSNGDIKTTTIDKTVYFYAENSTKYTKFKNGQEVFEYSTGQRETNRPDGSKEIIFPDGNTAHIFPDGSEKLTCKDGTVQKKSADASTTVIWHPDGFIDTLTREFKKREFADGTCKIVFKDGTNETRYPGGRVRIKTADGKVIHDAVIEK